MPSLLARLRTARLSASISRPFGSFSRALNGASAHALAHPSPGREPPRTIQHGVPHLREEMHVLMTVDEIRRASECLRKGGDLRIDLARERGPIELS